MTRTVSIEDGNELIAGFMSLEIKKTVRGETLYMMDNDGGFTTAGLKYHLSWDLLMPVVEKIENGLQWKYTCEIGNNLYSHAKEYYCHIFDAGNATRFECNSSDKKIIAVWIAVVEFIQFLKP